MPSVPHHLPNEKRKSKYHLPRKLLALILLIPLFFIFQNNTPFTSLPNSFEAFVGREEILSQMRKTFFTRAKQIPTIVLWGEGGIGKSETAIQFANQNLKKFSLVYWINVGSEEIYQQSYYNLAQHFEIANYEKLPFEKVRDKVHEVLENEKFKKPWLLIYDNADHSIPLPYRGHGKILITTRDKSQWQNAHCIEIPILSTQAACELYTKVVGKQPPTEWSALAEELNYFPLALYQALNYVKDSPHFTIKDYLLVAKRNKSVIFKQTLASLRYPHNLFAVWQMSAITMRAQNSDAYAWLQLCGYFHPDKIPINWVEKWLLSEGVSSDEAKAKAHDIFCTLVDQGHIRVNKSTQSFSLHRLKQELVKQEHEGGENYSEKALNFLTYLGNDFKYYKGLEWTDVSFEELSNWVLSATWWLAAHNQVGENCVKGKLCLLNGIANIGAIHRGEYEKILTLLDEAQDLAKDDLEEKVHTLLNRGYVYLITSQFDESQKSYEEALTLAKTPLEKYRCYHSFIVLENYKAQQNEALKWCRRAEELESRVFGSQLCAERIETMAWKGEVVRSKGDVSQALSYTLEALKSSNQIFGTRPTLQKIHLLIILSRMCLLIGETDLAAQCGIYANNMTKFWQGSMIAARTFHNLSTINLVLRKYKVALSATQNALEVYKTGDTSYSPLYYYTTLGNLGEIYLLMNKPKEAYHVFSKIEKSGFLDEYPKGSMEKYLACKDIGNSYFAIGQDEQAIPFLRRALSILTALYGDHHFAQKDIFEDLAKAYQKIDPEKAKVYFAKAEEAKKSAPKLSAAQREEIKQLIQM